MRLHNLFLLIALTAALTACATQPLALTASELPGFFTGIWHGLVAPLALIGEIFLNDRIYAFPNSGGWYDFGYMIGIGIAIGVILALITKKGRPRAVPAHMRPDID